MVGEERSGRGLTDDPHAPAPPPSVFAFRLLFDFRLCSLGPAKVYWSRERRAPRARVCVCVRVGCLFCCVDVASHIYDTYVPILPISISDLRLRSRSRKALKVCIRYRSYTYSIDVQYINMIKAVSRYRYRNSYVNSYGTPYLID